MALLSESRSSHQKYGSITFQKPHLHREKFQNSFIFQKVTMVKKDKNEMNRIREMESLNSFLGEDQLPHSRESNYQIVT